MLRILLMVFQNFWRVPGAWFKLCHYAKNTEKYPEITKWKHIQYVMKMAVNSGNLQFVLPNTPQFWDTVLYIDGELKKS